MKADQARTLAPADTPRSNSMPWTVDEVAQLFDLPFNDLLFRAQQAHRGHFDPSAIQLSTLLSIKIGGYFKVPFGGVKDSGIGSEGGTETLDGYLHTKFVTQMD